MINTEIKIHQFVNDGGDGFYIDFNLDLYETEPIEVNKSINDINDLSAIKSDHTLTIKLPGSNTNNKAFSNIYKTDWALSNVNLNVNYLNQFNPSLKTNVVLYCNGIVQLVGYLQLLRVNVTDEQKIEYECIIIGRVANLFSDIADKYLSDLSLGHSHVYSKTNIESSWVATVGEGYVYPMIDYAEISDEKNWYVENFYPSVYVKQIVDSIFSGAGYRYSSDFFDSNLFKRLIIPYSGKEFRMSESEVTSRKFYVDRTTDSSVTAITNYNGDYNNVVTLPYNHNVITSIPDGFNTSTHKFTIQTGKNGKYNFTADFAFQLINPYVTPVRFGTVVFDLRKNGNPIGQWIYNNGTNHVLLAFDGITLTSSITTQDVYCNDGDIIELTVRLSCDAGFFLQYKLLSGSRLFCNPSAQYAEGQTIVLNQVLPSDVKQTDFLSALCKMFNLYVEQDKLDDKKLIIEPRDNFYENTIIDLTEKVDYNTVISSELMGALKFKTYQYSFKEDTDLKNEQHQNKYKEPYGVRKFSVVNDFVKEEYKTEVLFSPTPLSDRYGVNNRIISRIWFNDPNEKSNQQSTANIRILYWGGIVAQNSPSVDWYFHDRSGSSTTYSIYPYAGHLDSVGTPTFDLNWGAPIELQYLADSYTDNNLFNKYHLKGMNEIIDPDSRLVTLSAWLNDVDRNQLSFRNYYKINQQYYRLYNVRYDATSFSPTELQLLKLKTAPEFVGDTYTINGGNTGTGEQGNGEPIYHLNSGRNGNSSDNGTDGLILGEDNLIAGDKSLINSKQNVVNGDYVTVIGGQNNAVPMDGVTLINCDSYQPSIENESAISNIQQPFYHSIELTKYDVSGIHTTALEIMSAKYGYWTEIVDSYITVYFNGASVVEFSSHKLNLQYSSDTYHICNYDNGITAVSVATKQRGVIVTDVEFLEDGISIKSNGNLGSTGSGIIKIELFYRLHKLLE